MEGHIVLAHELVIGDIRRPHVGAPPALPGGIRQAMGVGPFGGGGDIFDGGVEPDIEHLALHPRPRLITAPDRNAPMQIAGDAAVLQAVAVVQPLPGNRGGQQRPVGLAVDPRRQLGAQRALFQVKMPGFAHLQIGRARDRRARVDQVGRVELLGAIFALIAARIGIAAVRTGAGDVAVGQKAVVVDGENLLLQDFLDQPVVRQNPGEMLGQAVVALAGRPPEMIERQPEAPGNLGLHAMHFGAKLRDRLACLGRSQFGGGAVFVGGTDEHHFMTTGAAVTGEQVGGQLAAHQIAQMLDPVDIWNGGSDQNPCHDAPFVPAAPP